MSSTSINEALVFSILEDAIKKLDAFIRHNCLGCYKTDYGYENFYHGGHDLCIQERSSQLSHFLNQTRVISYYLDLDVISYNFRQRVMAIADIRYDLPPYLFEKSFIFAKLHDQCLIKDVCEEFIVRTSYSHKTIV